VTQSLKIVTPIIKKIMSNNHTRISSKHFFWLASYPKSGNTWFRSFLTSLLSDADQALDINNLGHAQIPNFRQHLDELNGFDSADLSFNELNCIRPEGLNWFCRRTDSNVYFKTHAAYTYNQNNHPILGSRNDGISGALYFVRNPLDVCISYAHHNVISIDKAIATMGNKQLKSHPDYTHMFIPEHVLSWSEHVNSWKDADDVPVMVVRYEDMLNSPFETFSKACQFLKLDTSDDNIRHALDSCHFEKLKKQEQESTFTERPFHAKSFFRKGIAGDWLKTLNTQQIERIVDQHGNTMDQLGYLNQDGSPKIC